MITAIRRVSHYPHVFLRWRWRMKQRNNESVMATFLINGHLFQRRAQVRRRLPDRMIVSQATCLRRGNWNSARGSRESSACVRHARFKRRLRLSSSISQPWARNYCLPAFLSLYPPFVESEVWHCCCPSLFSQSCLLLLCPLEKGNELPLITLSGSGNRYHTIVARFALKCPLHASQGVGQRSAFKVHWSTCSSSM